MHITYNKLLENTAKHILMQANPTVFPNAKFDKRWQKKAVSDQVAELKKALNKDPEKKQCVLDQCKYGKERAFRLHLLRRKFEI